MLLLHRIAFIKIRRLKLKKKKPRGTILLFGREDHEVEQCTLLLVLDVRGFFFTKILKLMQLVANKGSFHITSL